MASNRNMSVKLFNHSQVQQHIASNKNKMSVKLPCNKKYKQINITTTTTKINK